MGARPRLYAASGRRVPTETSGVSSGGKLPERERSTPTADAPTDGLIRAQRMDAAARTTRALAHELANYLGAMRSTLYLLAEDTPDDPVVREDLEVLARVHDEATELLEELRRFARPTPVGTGSADLTAVIRDVEPELNGAMRAGTTLRLLCGSEPLVVRGDAARLRLLVLDLVTTMSHSLADGGHLEVEAARAPFSACWIMMALLHGNMPNSSRSRASSPDCSISGFRAIIPLPANFNRQPNNHKGLRRRQLKGFLPERRLCDKRLKTATLWSRIKAYSESEGLDVSSNYACSQNRKKSR